MNLTIANHNSLKIIKGYQHYNDLDFIDLKEIVLSGYNYVACKLKDEIRKDDNFDGCVDVLILDIDNDCSIEQAKQIFKDYEYFIITTKSHQKSKNDLVCDRFRVFIPLEETVNDRFLIEKIYSDVILIYPFIDNACRNVSRLFFSSPKDAEIFYNEGKKYSIDILESISINENLQPQQKEKKNINVNYESVYILNELTGLWVNDFGETLESESLDDTEAKLKGARVLLDREFFKGNRNNACFSAICMLLNDGLSDDIVLDFITAENDARGKIPFNELMACFKSAKRTI